MLKKHFNATNLFLLFIVLLSFGASAQIQWGVSGGFCYQSVMDLDEEEMASFGIDVVSFELPCTCFKGVDKKGSWTSLYCTQNQLKQSRWVIQTVAPQCSEEVEFTEYRLIDDSRCVKCPEPKFVGKPIPETCVGNKLLMKRAVTAFVFDPHVSDCLEKDYVEFEFVDDWRCELPVVGCFLVSFEKYWWVLIVLFVALIVWKRKAIVKGVRF